MCQMNSCSVRRCDLDNFIENSPKFDLNMSLWKNHTSHLLRRNLLKSLAATLSNQTSSLIRQSETTPMRPQNSLLKPTQRKTKGDCLENLHPEFPTAGVLDFVID